MNISDWLMHPRRGYSFLLILALSFLGAGCAWMKHGIPFAANKGNDDPYADIRFTKNNQLLVKVFVGDRWGIFTVDSGVARTEIDRAFAERLGIRGIRTNDNVVGFHGTEQATRAIVAALAIDQKRFTNVVVHIRNIAPKTTAEESEESPNGIIGVDLLRQSSAVLNLEEKRSHTLTWRQVEQPYPARSVMFRASL